MWNASSHSVCKTVFENPGNFLLLSFGDPIDLGSRHNLYILCAPPTLHVNSMTTLMIWFCIIFFCLYRCQEVHGGGGWNPPSGNTFSGSLLKSHYSNILYFLNLLNMPENLVCVFFLPKMLRKLNFGSQSQFYKFSLPPAQNHKIHKALILSAQWLCLLQAPSNSAGLKRLHSPTAHGELLIPLYKRCTSGVQNQPRSSCLRMRRR